MNTGFAGLIDPRDLHMLDEFANPIDDAIVQWHRQVRLKGTASERRNERNSCWRSGVRMLVLLLALLLLLSSRRSDMIMMIDGVYK